MPLQTQLSEILSNSKDGSEFLRGLEKILKESDPKFSYAKVAKQCGFSSRAFVRELFIGKKKFTLATFSKFTRGLRFNQDQRDHCKALLMLDHTALNPNQIPQEILRGKIEIAAKKAKRVSQRKSLKQESPLNYLEHWPQVYASLAEGITLSEVIERTGLTTLQVSRALSSLVQAELVEIRESRYFALSPHLVLDAELFGNVIQKSFIETLKRGLILAEHDFRSKETFHFFSTFSVSTEQFLQLRLDLEELMLKFVDLNEQPEGKKIVSLGLTLI